MATAGSPEITRRSGFRPAFFGDFFFFRILPLCYYGARAGVRTRNGSLRADRVQGGRVCQFRHAGGVSGAGGGECLRGVFPHLPLLSGPPNAAR